MATLALVALTTVSVQATPLPCLDRSEGTDLYEIENKLDSIDIKLAAIPAQRDLTRVALLALLPSAVLVLFGMEAFLR